MPDGRARWEPEPRDGRVRIGLGKSQQVRWALLTLAVAAVAGGAGVVAGRPALVLAVGAMATVSLAYARFAGVELGPATITVVAPSLRRRTLWTRTMRWTTVLGIRATGTGEIWLALPGEPPLVLRAPRGRWLGSDPDFAEKLHLIETWWQVNSAASLLETSSTPYERVRQALDGHRSPPAPPPPPVPRYADPAPTYTEPYPYASYEATPAPFPPPAPEPYAPVAPEPFAPMPAPEPTGEHVLEPEAEGERAPFPVVALIGFFLMAAGVGYLLIGADIVVLAIALLVLLRFGRDPGRPLALGAFALLVLAAVSTVAQDRPLGVTLAYSTEGALAAEAGAVIGVFLVVSTIIFIATERSGPRAVRRGQGGVERVHLATLAAVLPAWVRAAIAYVVVAAASLGIRLAFAPSPLSPGYQPLLANLRLGTGYSLVAPSGGVPTGDLPPLAPVLVAYSPLGARAALLLVSILTVIGVGWVAHQRWGRAAGIMAAAFAAVLPALWGEQLPLQLAGLLVLAGVALADPAQVTTRRAVLAGACLGLAALARPDVALAVAVVAVWVRRQRRDAGAAVLALLVSAALVVLPWATFVWREFGSPWLTSSLPATFNDPLAASRLPGVVKAAVGAAFVAALCAALIRFWSRRGALAPFLLVPFVCVGLAFTEPLRRDPLAWSAPLAAVVLGRWAAEIVRGQLGPVLEVRYRDVVDWDIVFEEQQRKRGYGAAAWRSDAETPLEEEPEEDRLFL